MRPEPRWLLLAALLAVSPAQSSLPGSARGYVLSTPVHWQDPLSGEWHNNHLLHARQILRFWAGAYTLGVEPQQRWAAGEGASELLGITGDRAAATRSLDLEVQHDYAEGALICGIDRLWLDWERGSLQLRVGRQRIAWGTALIWNPLDLYNPATPQTIDQPEKPGGDALCLKYWLGTSSKLELAAAPGRDTAGTYALQWTTNWRATDWVLLGGRNRRALMMGTGWAGQLGDSGLRGEALCAWPHEGEYAHRAEWTATLDWDRGWQDTSYLHAAMLYASRGSRSLAGGTHLLKSIAEGLLSPARWSLFLEASRNLGSLLTVRVSLLQNPDDGSTSLGPDLNWSVTQNLELRCAAWISRGATGSEFGDNGDLWLLQGRWSW